MEDHIMTKPPRPPDTLEWPEDQSPELPEAHYAAIGRVASEWASLEATIDTCSHHLADITAQAGVCFTSQIAGTGRKIDAYIALARLQGASKTISALNEFAKDSQRLAEQRNRIIHDPWIGATNPHRLEASARKTLRLGFIPTSTDAVLALATKIMLYKKRIIEIAEKVTLEVRTSRGKPPPPSP
jgi:hypothetical protein